MKGQVTGYRLQQKTKATATANGKSKGKTKDLQRRGKEEAEE